MPDAEFGFKPTPAQQSFAERLMHVVSIDVKLLSTLGGKTPAPNVNAKASSKADVARRDEGSGVPTAPRC